MPQKVFHVPNPSTMEKWEAMSDAKDWYVIVHDAVGTIAHARTYTIDDRGMARKVNEAVAGDVLHQGSIVPAKSFGVGVDLQRLVDLGAIRQATPWEEETILRDFSDDAGIVKPVATPDEPAAHPAKADSHKSHESSKK